MSTKKTEFKVCPRCGRSLPRSAFSQNLYQSGERQGYCKSCCNSKTHCNHQCGWDKFCKIKLSGAEA